MNCEGGVPMQVKNQDFSWDGGHYASAKTST